MAKEICKTLEEAQEKWPQIPFTKYTKDLTNQKFNRITCLYKTNNRKPKITTWVCLCDCGNYFTADASAITCNSTKSCGCLKTEIARQNGLNSRKDLTNQKFGKLTALKYIYTINNSVYWECQCDCGNKTIVSRSNLCSGNIKSCGCLLEKTYENRKKDITGLQSGYLIAIESTDKITPNGHYIWKCLCTNCGNYVYKSTHDLISHHVKSCGCIKSFGEKIILTYLQKNNINYKKEYSFSDLKNKGKLRFDFALFNKNNDLLCLIEFQGKQHYDNTNFIGKYQREISDPMKKEYCQNNNIKLYEIKYNDNIEESLNNILNENHLSNNN